jgi:hypothetical protein
LTITLTLLNITAIGSVQVSICRLDRDDAVPVHTLEGILLSHGESCDSLSPALREMGCILMYGEYVCVIVSRDIVPLKYGVCKNGNYSDTPTVTWKC